MVTKDEERVLRNIRKALVAIETAPLSPVGKGGAPPALPERLRFTALALISTGLSILAGSVPG